MRHDLVFRGYAFRLRPISDADAALVVEMRSNAQLNKFLHATSRSVDDQIAWLARYYERPGDYYFVVERLDSGTAEGVISIYNIDAELRSGEWGRWILKSGSMAAVESALMIYRCAFEKLGLQEVFCRTVAENVATVSFHDSCGITDRSLLPGRFDLHGQHVDAVEHRVNVATWQRIQPRMEALAQLVAKRLQHG